MNTPLQLGTFALYLLLLGVALLWVWPKPHRAIWLLLALLPLHTLAMALIFHLLHPSRILLGAYQAWKDVVLLVALLRVATSREGWLGQRFHIVDLAMAALAGFAVLSLLLHRPIGLAAGIQALRSDFILVPFYAVGRLSQTSSRSRAVALSVVVVVGMAAATWGVVERFVDPIPFLRQIELPAFERFAYGVVFASPYGLPYSYFQANFARRIGSFTLTAVGFATLGCLTVAAAMGILRSVGRVRTRWGMVAMAALAAGVVSPVLAAGRLALLIVPVLLVIGLYFTRQWVPVVGTAMLLLALYGLFSLTIYGERYPHLPVARAAAGQPSAAGATGPPVQSTATLVKLTPLVSPEDQSVAEHMRSLKIALKLMHSGLLGGGMGEAGLSAVRNGLPSGEGQIYTLAADLGVPGLASALVLLLLGCWTALRVVRSSPEPGFGLATLLLLVTVTLTTPIAEIFTDLFAMAATFWFLGQVVRLDIAINRPARGPILIDVTCLRTAQAGVRRYAEGLRRSFEAVSPTVPVLNVSMPVPRYRTPDSMVRKVIRHMLLLGWYQLGLPLLAMARRATLLVCPEYYCPWVAPCPRLVVFHDSLFWDRPEYPRWWRALLAINAVGPARRANIVATPSTSQVPRLAHLLRRAEAEMVVLPPLIVPMPQPDDLEADLGQLNLSPGYLLHLGALERRKDIPALIQVYADVCKSQPDCPSLVLAGPRSPIAALDDLPAIERVVEQRGLDHWVRVVGMVPEATLPALFHGALALVSFSQAEGFGLPLAEAMAAGVPVVALRSQTTSEVVGDAGLLVASDDREAWVQALNTVVRDASVRAAMIARGRERAGRYGVQAAVDRLNYLLHRS